jgi:hypothetical protein
MTTAQARTGTAKDGAAAIAMLAAEVKAEARAAAETKALLEKSKAVREKQSADRKAAKVAAEQKAAGTPKAVKVTPATKTSAKASGSTQAERVRAALEEGKSVTEAAVATGVPATYVWDIAAAWERKTGKWIIPSHVAKAQTTS